MHIYLFHKQVKFYTNRKWQDKIIYQTIQQSKCNVATKVQYIELSIFNV